MINLSELITDPDFAQPYTIVRSSGTFVLGGFASTTTSIAAVGPIVVATEEDLDQVDPGDRITGSMKFYSQAQIYETHGGSTPGLSDTILWRGDNYRILKVFPYADYGWYEAVGARMTGN
jgi:hypothetical protein